MNIIQSYPAEILVKETGALISLPKVCLKLKSVQSDPNHSMTDIAEIIMHDPALTTRILRIVNSAYYGLLCPVKNITHALGILGAQDLNNLVIVTSIVNTMNSLKTSLNLESFWRTSIFSGVMAKTLGEHFNNPATEELFLSGLLLKVGKLLIYYKEPDLLVSVEAEMQKSGRTDFDVEQSLLGFDHAEVGAVMAQSWRFSDLLKDCIAHHNEFPIDSLAPEYRRISFMAGFCANLLDIGSQQEINIDEVSFAQTDYLEQLELSEKVFTGLLKTSYERYLQAYDAFCGGVQ